MRVILEPNKGKEEVELKGVTITDMDTGIRVIQQYLDALAVQWPEAKLYQLRVKRRK